MKRNKIISTTLAITNFIKWVFIALILGLVVMLVHSGISPDLYEDFYIRKDQTTLSFNLTYCTNCIHDDLLRLSELRNSVRFWTLIHYSAFGLLVYLITNRVLLILKSVKDYNTFYNTNVEHFKQISKYAFWIFLIGLFNFIDEGSNGVGLQLGFQAAPLFISLFSLVLGEIFKEGKLLQEDKNAII